MLAYIFWHRPRGDVIPDEYERRLRAFHEALGANPSPGFLGSTVFRADGLRWSDAKTAYEDWYFLESSAALDLLNDLAVSEACRPSHEAVAARAAEGAGGLYRLLRGIPHGGGGRHAVWLSKPKGASYDDFLARLDPMEGATLWQRLMSLGPAPEFCLAGIESRPDPASLPDAWEPIVVERAIVWPETGD